MQIRGRLREEVSLFTFVCSVGLTFSRKFERKCLKVSWKEGNVQMQKANLDSGSLLSAFRCCFRLVQPRTYRS